LKRVLLSAKENDRLSGDRFAHQEPDARGTQIPSHIYSSLNGVRISEEEALTDITLRSQMITLGSVIGMKLSTGSYTFRRGNDEALDNSSE